MVSDHTCVRVCACGFRWVNVGGWVCVCVCVCLCVCVRITCAWARAHKREGNKKQVKGAHACPALSSRVVADHTCVRVCASGGGRVCVGGRVDVRAPCMRMYAPAGGLRGALTGARRASRVTLVTTELHASSEEVHARS